MMADEAEPVRGRSLSRRRLGGRCPPSASASLASRIANASELWPPPFLQDSVLPDVGCRRVSIRSSGSSRVSRRNEISPWTG